MVHLYYIIIVYVTLTIYLIGKLIGKATCQVHHYHCPMSNIAMAHQE